MAKQANRMMIGGFVVIAVVILAASLVVFGSGKFFKKTEGFVMYFDGSIKGLNVGAPVLFQGVQIGSVTSIVLQADVKQHTLERPVVIEIEPDKFQLEEGQEHRDPSESLPELIDRGLRAVLTMQSFITGQLMIELDFLPNTPVYLKNINKEFPEIPTIPSTTERLAQTLQKLDLEKMEKNLEDTLAGIDRFVNNPDLKVSIGELKGVLTDARGLVQNLNTRIGPLADGLDATLRDARKMVNNVDTQVGPIADNVNKTVEDFGKLARDADTRLGAVAENLDRTLSSARGVISDDAPLIVEMENTLREISASARSIRQLANTLDQQPEALIQGLGKSGEK
jgi:paraquat-inducible protein B